MYQNWCLPVFFSYSFKSFFLHKYLFLPPMKWSHLKSVAVFLHPSHQCVHCTSCYHSTGRLIRFPSCLSFTVFYEIVLCYIWSGLFTDIDQGEEKAWILCTNPHRYRSSPPPQGKKIPKPHRKLLVRVHVSDWRAPKFTVGFGSLLLMGLKTWHI